MTIDETRAEEEPTGEPSEAPADAPRKSSRLPILAVIAAVVIIDILAFVLVPPPPGESGAGKYPTDGIAANLELVPPHVIYDPIHGDEPVPGALVFFEPTITSTILTSWIVMAFILIFAFVFTRGLQDIPRRGHNFIEFIYESLSNFAYSIGGDQARRYVPLFAALFLFILFSNWSGLLPLVGKVELLRAPTSDLNITHRPGARQLRHVPRRRRSQPRPARLPRRSSSRSASSARESGPGCWACSSGPSSSCSSSSSPSHWQCDSLATSTAGRSRSAS